MKKVTLGQVITPAKVVRCGENEYPVLSMTMHDGIVLQSDRFNKSLASNDKSNYKVVYKNQLVVGFPIDEGVLYVQKCQPVGIMSPAYNVWDIDTSKVKEEFLELVLHSPKAMQYYADNLRGSTARRRSIPASTLLAYEFVLPSLDVQNKYIEIINKQNTLLELKKQQYTDLETLLTSRFIELFGDLKTNPYNWDCKNFLDVAKIDTVMVHDYEKYAKYPHIGIDSIEKNTGRLFGYRTIAEDGIISGKYLFTNKHIIYSKIRPNLNKVALPDFEGLCSADSYPILPKEDICIRCYLGYVMRSDFFLDYILPFSKRANMPKVNKAQLSGFVLPVPPIKLQQQFADFVEQVEKAKQVIKEQLEQLEILKKSLMQKYFG